MSTNARDKFASVNPGDRLPLDFNLPRLPYAREIMRYAWRVYKQNLGVLAVMTLLVALPFEFLNAYLWAPFVIEKETTTVQVIYVASILLISAFQTLLIPVATHSIIARMRRGENPPLRESFDFGTDLWVRTVWVRFLAGLGIACACLLLIVRGILLWYRWLFAEVIVAVEQRTQVGDILKRSAELSDGYRMDMFVAMFLTSIPLVAVAWAADHVKKAFPHWAVEASVSGLIYFAGMYFLCLILVCYLDRRGREAIAKKMSAGA